MRPNLSDSKTIALEGNLVPDAKISAAFPGTNLGRKKSKLIAAKNTTIEVKILRFMKSKH